MANKQACRTDKIVSRQEKEKVLLIEQLKKAPVIQIACQKTGIGRATFYRWKNSDEKFAKDAEEALTEGSALINDLAESQLLAAIKEQNMTAIIFWLKHHHPNYTTRLELLGHVDHHMEAITPEQEQIIEKALKITQALQNEEQ